VSIEFTRPRMFWRRLATVSFGSVMMTASFIGLAYVEDLTPSATAQEETICTFNLSRQEGSFLVARGQMAGCMQSDLRFSISYSVNGNFIRTDRNFCENSTACSLPAVTFPNSCTCNTYTVTVTGSSPRLPTESETLTFTGG